MIDPAVQREIREEERALLRRCTPFILAGPARPGGDPVDVIYLTPDGRWLRICRKVRVEDWQDYEWKDPGRGAALWISSAEAAYVFYRSNYPEPPELASNTAWDGHVADGQARGDYHDKYVGMRTEDLRRLAYLESLGTNTTYKQRETLCWLTAQRSWKKSIRPPGPAPTEDKYCRDARVCEIIPRTTLHLRLRAWSADWPSPLEARAEELSPCEQHILLALLDAGHRMTKAKMQEALDKPPYHDGASTVGAGLSELMGRGFLDNSQKGRPKGYGLTPLGRKVAASVLRPKATKK